EVEVSDHDGKAHAPVKLRPVSSVGQVARLDPAGDEVLLRSESYTALPAWLCYDPAHGKLTPTALRRTSPVDFSDVEVIRETATSTGGAKVPLTIIRRRGTHLDGKSPTLLTG